MTITLETLNGLEACRAAQRAFERAYPNGCPDWLTLVTHPDCRMDWKEWIAVKAPSLILDERLRLVDELDEPDYWRGRIAAHSPNISLPERLALADESRNPGYWGNQIVNRYRKGLTA